MQNPRYIVAEGYPSRLQFRNAAVALEVVASEDMWKRQEWCFRARKVEPDGAVLKFAWAHYHRSALERIIHESGFLVVEDSPEERLLKVMVARGHATKVC